MTGDSVQRMYGTMAAEISKHSDDNTNGQAITIRKLMNLVATVPWVTPTTYVKTSIVRIPC